MNSLFQHLLQLWSRLLSLLRRGRHEREMEEEMRFHLEMLIEQNLPSGMPADCCVAKITWDTKILNVTSVQATTSKRSATNLTCPRMSPFPIPSTCPFRIMFMAS